MEKPNPDHARSRPRSRLPVDQLKAIPLLRVLNEYGVIDNMFERRSTASGPSPFSDGGVLRADLNLNVWSDSGGRPVIDGEIVASDVVGLVQVIEGVSYARALEILHERFILGIRRRTSTALGPETNKPFVGELEGLVADVPYLRYMGIPPGVAQAWGVGWCPVGLMQGRITFPVRRPDNTLVGYAGLDPTLNKPEDRWRFTDGLQPELELFGIERIHRNDQVKKAAFARGITLADDPLEVVRIVQQMGLPVISPLGVELSRAQIRSLLRDNQ